MAADRERASSGRRSGSRSPSRPRARGVKGQRAQRTLSGSRSFTNISAPVCRRQRGRNAMRKHTHEESTDTHTCHPVADHAVTTESGLPNRLLTAFEVAEFVGCHEETVRRAYWRGLLVAQRFGVRGKRFHPADVMDWLRRGAPTKVS
jgi:excisionase family DNA binding protein